MSAMFGGCENFNGDVSQWDVSRVIDMSGMFFKAFLFDSAISNWDVSAVTDMSSMFGEASSFNIDLSKWDVSTVRNMGSMFWRSNFNGNISTWNTSNVTQMNEMFFGATLFTNNISNWDISNVNNITGMFNGAASFSNNLGSWNLQSIVAQQCCFDLHEFLSFSGISQQNYEATLLGWAENINTPSNLTLGASTLMYCNEEGRNILVNEKGWTIIGDVKLNTGDSCEDSNPNTQGETIDADCNCRLECSTITDQNLTICEGEIINIGESNFTQSGQYNVSIITEAGCDSTINLDLTVIPDPTFDIELADAVLCPEETDFRSLNLDDNIFSFSWESTTAQFTDPTADATEIMNLATGLNTIRFTTTTLDDCSFVLSRDFTIFVDDTPLLQEDRIEAIYGQAVSIPDPSTNDDLTAISDDYTITVDQQSLPGDLESTGQNQWNWTPAPGCLGEIRLPYTVCNEACADLCSTSEIIINITPADGDAAALIPTGISPNGDGINDSFVIPILKSFPQNFPENQLRIINRWGQTLFEAQPYANDWAGTDRSGSPLVQGTYYYHWDPATDEEVVTGRVSILR